MNIVIWVADSLRPDHLGVYGSNRGASPSIDALAKDAVVFEKAHAQATWTRPSSGTLFTGMYPAVHGARTFAHGLRPTAPRLPALLQEVGMTTAVFTAIGHVSAAVGYDEGVDFFCELWRQEPYSSGERPTNLITAREVRERAEHWIQEQIAEETPFFALLWTIDTHVPFEIEQAKRYFPQTDYEDGAFSVESIEGIWAAEKESHLQALLDAYDASIMETDAQLGKLVKFLQDRGVYDETIIIVLGDHGEIFNEHSRGQFSPLRRILQFTHHLPILGRLITRYRLLNPFGWLGHLETPPYEEVLWVPVIAKFPNNRWRGQREEVAVELVDLPPTLLALAGQDPEAARMQGRNLLPLLEENGLKHNRFIFSDSQTHENHLRYVSVQQGEWKLIRTIAPTIEDRSDIKSILRTYSQRWLTRGEILVNTQDEHRDWKNDQGEIYLSLKECLDEWLADNERLAAADHTIVEDPRLRDQLASLGYLQQ